MIVICLEGPHGSGKTSLCKEIAERGLNVMDEAFFTMPKFALHPQSLVMETLWVTHWVQRLLEKQKALKNATGKNTVFFADRSPYSAVFYAKTGGQLLRPVIAAMIAELANNNIHIFTVHIKVDPDILWNRIQARLMLEPERVQYNEADRLWMDRTVQFYDSSKWDYTVNNNEESINDVIAGMLNQLATELTHFSDLGVIRDEFAIAVVN